MMVLVGAFPRAKEFFRVRVENARVVSYSDDKGIVAGKRPELDQSPHGSAGVGKTVTLSQTIICQSAVFSCQNGVREANDGTHRPSRRQLPGT